MKKKFIFLTMLLLTLVGGVKFNVLNAQETITIGSGDGNSNTLPFETNSYEYSMSQQIYTATELNGQGAGMITSLAFKPAYDATGFDSNVMLSVKAV